MATEIDGIVTAVKADTNPIDSVYTILSDRVYRVRSAIDLQLMEHVSGKLSGGALEDATIHGKASDAEYRDALSRLTHNVIDIKRARMPGLAYDGLVERMSGAMRDAAAALLKRLVTGAPVVVRFHNDGDGASGAIGLYRAVEALGERISDSGFDVSWRMNRSIAYTADAFYADEARFNSYRSVELPLVLITDFGTTEESADAIGMADGKLELVWMDHHKTFPEFPRQTIGHYINTWDYGGDSALTAGAMTCIFARLLSDVDVRDMMAASFVSDYSPYADAKDKVASDLALILDYFTSRNGSHPAVTPKHIDSVISDNTKRIETLSTARHSLEEALRAGLSNIKRYRNGSGVNIYALDFNHVAELGMEYPLPGRFSSKLQAHLEELNGGKTMIIVYYGSYISMRVSRDILDTVDTLKLISKLKGSDPTINGGGHREAASIRTDKDNVPKVMKLLLLEIGAQA